MKTFISLILLSVLFLSCEENFDPFGNYKDKFVLTSLINLNEGSQVATLSKSYFTNSFNPYDNTTDPSVDSAEIRLWNGDSVYLFQDSSIQRIDTTHYRTPFKFYYLHSQSFQLNRLLEIEALLPSGKRLKAKTTTPNDISFSTQNPNVIPPVNQDYLTFSWQSQSYFNMYLARILVTYFKFENGTNVRYEKEIPIGYSTKGGIEYPVYPSATRQNSVSYSVSVINKFFNELSTDENKNLFYIEIKPKVEIIVLDEVLSRYYSSTSKNINDLSVRLDENDYTNIEGGLGIFGSYYIKKVTSISFIASYLQSFGYNVIYN